MKFYLSAFIFLFIGFSSMIEAQEGYTEGGFVNHNSNLINGDYSFRANKMDLSEIRGDALFWEDAKKGFVVFKNGNRTDEYLINYDVLNDLLLFNRGEDWLSVETITIDSVILASSIETFVMCRNSTDEIEPSMMQLLSDGEYSLFKMKKAKLKRPTYNPALNTGNKFHEVKMKDIFIVCNNGSCFELPNSVKKILKSKSIPQELKTYAEDSGFKKMKKESQAIEFIEVINQAVQDQATEK